MIPSHTILCTLSEPTLTGDSIEDSQVEWLRNSAQFRARLQQDPTSLCAEEITLGLASLAYQESTSSREPCGLSLLVPNETEDRCWFAVQTHSETWLGTKEQQDCETESFYSQVLQLLRSDPMLSEGETIALMQQGWRVGIHFANSLHRSLWLDQQDSIFTQATSWEKESKRGLLPGSFNPLHHAHRSLRDLGERLIESPVVFELSIRNVEKFPLDYLSLSLRASQFEEQPLVLTNAPTFVEKARLFPQTTFLLGIDTAVRVLDSRFYAGEESNMKRALNEIEDHGCSFLVAARFDGSQLFTLSDFTLPADVKELFREIPVSLFQENISSTAIRRETNLWQKLGLTHKKTPDPLTD